MELTKLQIQQINNFLEAIGVEYVDIRFEMVDHIASEIEGTVSDLDTFFKNDRLQTPFLKYMLSKKDTYKKKYDRIVKRKLWSDILNIGKDMCIQIMKPLNFLIITFVIAVSFFLVKLENDATIFFPAIITFGYLGYHFTITRKFMKTYGKLKIVHSYSFFGGIISNVLFQCYNIIDYDKFDGTWNSFLYYIFLITFIGSFLSGCSFISKMESIENKYKQLI